MRFMPDVDGYVMQRRLTHIRNLGRLARNGAAEATPDED